MFVKIFVAVGTLLLISLLGMICFKTLSGFQKTFDWEIGDKFVYTYLNKDEEVLEITALDFDNELVIFKDEDGERHSLSFENFKNNSQIRRK